MWLLDDAEPKLRGIDRERFCDLVELHFLAEAALRRAVSALGTARRFVREDATALKVISGNVVRHGLQGARIKSARHAVRSVGTTVEQRFEPNRRDCPIGLDARRELHEDRMASAVTVKNFFARETDLDRAIEQPRGLRHDHLVVEGVAFAAEAAAVRGCDHADMRGRHVERFGQRAVNIVRRLSARPERQLAVGILDRDRRVLLDGQVRAALIKERVLEDAIGGRQPLVCVAKPKRDNLVNVAARGVIVDAGLVSGEALLGTVKGPERLILHINEIERFESGQLVARDDRGDRVADKTHTIAAKRVLILAHGQNAVGDREVGARQDQMDAWMRCRASGVDFRNPRMGQRRAQEFRV